MHELAITQSVVDTIAERTSGARVTIVRLDIGKLSGVVPDAVAFCFDLVANGTPLDGAKLEIFEPAIPIPTEPQFELDFSYTRVIGDSGPSVIAAHITPLSSR